MIDLTREELKKEIKIALSAVNDLSASLDQHPDIIAMRCRALAVTAGNIRELGGRLAGEAVAPSPLVDRVPPAWVDVLGPYGPVIIDKGCREPIAWGFKLTKKLGEEEFKALKESGLGDLEWIGKREDPTTEWPDDYALVTQWLNGNEAITKYGPLGKISWGPRGGFLGVFYGDKEFNHKRMQPPGAKKP